MSRHIAPVTLVFTLSVLALSACDESTTPTEPQEPASQSAAAAASYSVQDLAIRDVGEGGAATSINDAGQVVGWFRRPDDALIAFIWQNGVSTNLGSLGGFETQAFDINDLGQVVGAGETSFDRIRAFRWQNGVMKNLGSLGGRDSRAFAINNNGHIVGSSQLTGNPRDPQGNRITHAFLVRNGVMTDLGTLGGFSSAALDINDGGQVVGWSETSKGVRHPFLWQNGTMRDLLPGSPTSTGTALAINPLGVVVGERNNRAFRYSGGVMRNLPVGTPSVAMDIRAGRVVGSVGPRSFVLAGGEVTLLPRLPGIAEQENQAWAINRAGAIVGATHNLFDSHVKITMWTPQ